MLKTLVPASSPPRRTTTNIGSDMLSMLESSAVGIERRNVHLGL
jgi:hypothetical protein